MGAQTPPNYYEVHNGAGRAKGPTGAALASDVGAAFRHRAGNDAQDGSDANVHYWHALIREGAAAEFCGLTIRTMQALRQRGGGPRFVRRSARCLRYRRADLKQWADSHLHGSTAESA